MEDIQKILFEEATKISEPLRITVVECSVKGGKNGSSILVVIEKEGGITVNDCEKVSRLLGSRVEVLGLGGLENYNLQVTSPGIDREFKDRREYNIFKSKKVKVILRDPLEKKGGGQDNVLKGTLLGISDDIVKLERDDEVVSIPLRSIRRTELDG
ncbi:MAG TPA: ribosome maturation factor RimP [Spirochaetota bacterium]|nr:ribosome maturation factor RimP [Spirochaetota bacterium]